MAVHGEREKRETRQNILVPPGGRLPATILQTKMFNEVKHYGKPVELR
jgi:hypothetical protein